MPVFKIQPVSLANGSFAAAWFDNERCLWNDVRLRKAVRLSDGWEAPQLELHRPKLGATPVLFNPNAYAVSPEIRDELAGFPELELLPVQIQGHGVFFLIHVLAAQALPAGSTARINEVSGNITEIREFPSSFEPLASFFRIRQPATSAAGQAGSFGRAIYASSKGARAIERVAANYLTAVAMAHTLE